MHRFIPTLAAMEGAAISELEVLTSYSNSTPSLWLNFLPVYIQQWSIDRGNKSYKSVQVRHHPRTLGKSKYGLGRIFRVLMDLTTVYFLQRFRQKPMHFIGFLGGVCMLGSIVAAASTSRSLVKTAHVWGYSMAISSASPGFVLSLQLLIMGLQVLLLHLLFTHTQLVAYASQEMLCNPC